MMLTKIGFRHRYNCTEMRRRRWLNGRQATIDDLKDWFDDSVERRCGRVIEFGCTTAAKYRYLCKNQDLRFARIHAAEVNMALLLGKIHLEYLYNFWYYLHVTQSERLMHCSGGMGHSKWFVLWGIVGTAVILGALARALQSYSVCCLFNCDP